VEFFFLRKILTLNIISFMQARLILKGGEVITGQSFGYEGHATGEIVFNTGMI